MFESIELLISKILCVSWLTIIKAILEIVSLVAENSSIPNDVGNLPLFLTYLSLEIPSRILFTELVEILYF